MASLGFRQILSSREHLTNSVLSSYEKTA